MITAKDLPPKYQAEIARQTAKRPPREALLAHDANRPKSPPAPSGRVPTRAGAGKRAGGAAADAFCHLCATAGLPMPVREHKFHPSRKWRFDYCFKSQQVALEVEGGAYTGGRHTRPIGFIGDMEKYSEAASLGWLILRVTPKNLMTVATTDLIRRTFVTIQNKRFGG